MFRQFSCSQQHLFSFMCEKKWKCSNTLFAALVCLVLRCTYWLITGASTDVKIYYQRQVLSSSHYCQNSFHLRKAHKEDCYASSSVLLLFTHRVIRWLQLVQCVHNPSTQEQSLCQANKTPGYYNSEGNDRWKKKVTEGGSVCGNQLLRCEGQAGVFMWVCFAVCEC